MRDQRYSVHGDVDAYQRYIAEGQRLRSRYDRLITAGFAMFLAALILFGVVAVVESSSLP